MDYEVDTVDVMLQFADRLNYQYFYFNWRQRALVTSQVVTCEQTAAPAECKSNLQTLL